MQQFVVPQFLDIEDKIFGPITIRQFLILLVGSIFGFLSFRLFDFWLFIIILVFDSIISVTFAFLKINGQSFHYFVLNIIETLRKPGLRIWQKNYSKKELNYFRNLGMHDNIVVVEKKKKARRDRIRDLALVVNTGGYYRPDQNL